MNEQDLSRKVLSSFPQEETRFVEVNGEGYFHHVICDFDESDPFSCTCEDLIAEKD